jgi:D-alanyl-D-alanine carboxypeptidase
MRDAVLQRGVRADPDVRPYFLAALPLAGVNGTLADRMRRPPGNRSRRRYHRKPFAARVL